MQERSSQIVDRQITFADIAAEAGYLPAADGKLNLPPSQGTADALGRAVDRMFGDWRPGDPRISLTITGAGPVWGYLAIEHALHGRVARLIYAAPNCTVTIYSHGI